MASADPRLAEPLPALLARDGFRSPDLFVQQIDPVARTARRVRQRGLPGCRCVAAGQRGVEMPHDDLVRRTQAISEPPMPLHFIFHAGHVGSTLLSRLIEAAAGLAWLERVARAYPEAAAAMAA